MSSFWIGRWSARPSTPAARVVNVLACVAMCRNIKTLFNFEPPATDEEIRAACVQFVRKLSGFTHPSRENSPQFDLAVDDTFHVADDSWIPSARTPHRVTARSRRPRHAHAP